MRQSFLAVAMVLAALFGAAGAMAGESGAAMGLTPNGVRLLLGVPKGEITLHWPLMSGNGERAPKVLQLAGKKAKLEYPGGAKWDFTLEDDGTMRMVPDGARNPKDTGLVHNLEMPILLKDGCAARMENGESKAFPAQKESQPMLWRGDNKTLTVTDAAGNGFVFTVPFGWGQLQDNRHWNNNQSFQYKVFSGLPGNAGYNYVFSLKPLKGALAIVPAAALDPYAYVPYPEAREELWPGKGPIRAFGWQEGIRKGFVNKRVADANAVFFIGDSLTENWRTLAKDLAPVKVANRGVGGDTSRGCLFRLPHEVIAHQPAVVVIAAGTNDLTAHGAPEDCLFNLREMIAICRKYNGDMPIILCTVPPSSQPDAPLKPGALDALNAGIRKLCAEEKCLLADRHAMALGPDGQQDLSLFGKDRLHFGPKGYEKWAALMRPLLTNEGLGGKDFAKREKVDLTGYEIVWRDEFDGDKVDATKWGSPVQQRQGASTWDPKHVSVKDGNAVFKIVKTADPTYRYASACLRTTKSYALQDRLYQFTYGYVEARVKLHHWMRTDYWFALWMMAGRVADDTPDTRKGCEIDVMESFRMYKCGAISHALHWNGYGKLHNATGQPSFPNLLLLNDDYHTFGCLWTPEFLAFTIDGEITWKTDLKGLGEDKDGKTKSQGVPAAPAYIKLSVEAAPWAGPWWQWEKEMPAEDEVKVDWVRVWQKKDGAPAK
ncbi:MAG: family 16 glycosylhydrolase [Planctomycetes bacterium]|nr:family 16 glycosylhydrolase [Planctomycetota bacterium]